MKDELSGGLYRNIHPCMYRYVCIKLRLGVAHHWRHCLNPHTSIFIHVAEVKSSDIRFSLFKTIQRLSRANTT